MDRRRDIPLGELLDTLKQYPEKDTRRDISQGEMLDTWKDLISWIRESLNTGLLQLNTISELLESLSDEVHTIVNDRLSSLEVDLTNLGGIITGIDERVKKLEAAK